MHLPAIQHLPEIQLIQLRARRLFVAADATQDFHAKCADSIMDPWEKNDRNNNWIGNNIYPGNANLGSMLASPTIRGALTSVLGPDYGMHLHRALHVSSANDQGAQSPQPSVLRVQRVVPIHPVLTNTGFHKDTPEGG
eukprot:SAG31_NODE_4647_length_3070_cov_2.252777_1_plen_137_part_10